MATKRQKSEAIPVAVFQVATMPEDLAASAEPTTADSAGVQRLRAAGADALDTVDLAGPLPSRLNVTRDELLEMVSELGHPITPQFQTEAAAPLAAVVDAAVPPMSDVLAALGWSFEQHEDGWHGVHAVAQVTTPGFIDHDLAIQAALMLERSVTNPRVTGDSWVDRLRAARTVSAQDAPDDPPRRSTPADPYWAHGPVGKAAKAAHLWDEPEPYTWRSRCGKYTFAERKPAGEPGGNRCPVCAEREHATAQPPERIPPEAQPMTTETESLPLNHLFARTGPERQEVRRDAIVVGRYQPRKTFDQAALEQLAASIREHGILNPLQVFQNERGQLELIAGERRLRAAGLAGLETVPVDVKALTLAQIHEISLIDNLQREQLSEVEEGLAYEQLISDLGVSENKLAQRLGKSRGHIQQRRAIAKAAPEVQQALQEQRLSLTQARAIALAAPGDHGVQREALERVTRDLKMSIQVSEEDAREKTVRIAATTHKKALKALGWKVQIDEHSYKPPLIWSKTDRPRQWTGAEIISAVQEQRRPTAGTPVTDKPDPEDVALMNAWAGQNGVVTSTCAPWVACCISAEGRRTTVSEFLSADELHTRCETLRLRLVAPMGDRLQAYGWTLQLEDREGWTITHTSGYTLSAWNWTTVEQRATQIEQGKIDTSKPQEPRSVSKPLACVICGTTEGLSWVGNLRDYYCQTDGRKALAELEQLKVQRRERTAAILEPLAAQADVDALRLLLFWSCSGQAEYQKLLDLEGYNPPERIAARLQTLDDAAIRRAAAQVLTARLMDTFGTGTGFGLLVDQPAEATA